MQRLRPGRFVAWLGALGALALVVGLVPAAGEPPGGGKPTRQVSLAVFVCIGDSSPQNCGPGLPRLRTAGGAKTLASAPFPELARRAGTIAVFLPSGKKAFSCPGPCTSLLPPGTRVKITAKPNQEPNRTYKVDHVEGCEPGSQNPCLLTLGRQSKVRVVFASDYGP